MVCKGGRSRACRRPIKLLLVPAGAAAIGVSIRKSFPACAGHWMSEQILLGAQS